MRMNSNKPQNVNKPKKKVGLYIFFAAVTIFFLSLILSFQDIGSIFKVIASADPLNLLWAVLLLLVYLALYPVTICLLMKSQKLNISPFKSYTIGMTEHFFNGITPFATGGQPFEVYAFSQEKIKPEDSTSVLLMNFIIHMIVTNLFAIVSLIYFPYFAGNDIAMYIIAIVGFTMNFGVLFFIIALATSKRLSNGLMAVLKKLCNIKWIGKFLTSKLPRVQDYFDNTQSAFRKLWKNKKVFFACIGIRTITMFAYYSITFFILKALRVPIGYEAFLFATLGSCFAITMVVFLPTPGSSGGIEFAFENILSSITASSSAISFGGMLLWRLLTYYLLMIVSLVFYIILEAKHKKKSQPEPLTDTETDNFDNSLNDKKNSENPNEILKDSENLAEETTENNENAESNENIENK